jgi:t-SNARE complex subunit (syntaxin)
VVLPDCWQSSQNGAASLLLTPVVIASRNRLPFFENDAIDAVFEHKAKVDDINPDSAVRVRRNLSQPGNFIGTASLDTGTPFSSVRRTRHQRDHYFIIAFIIAMSQQIIS